MEEASLKGEVEEIIFQNKENGYTIFVIKDKEDEEITRYFQKHLLYDERNKESSNKKPSDWGIYTYEIKGDASDFTNWKLIDKENMLY